LLVSSSPEIYLDNNATTLPLPEVMAAVTEAMSCSFGNPSSSHRFGERSRQLLRASREAVAKLIGVQSDYLSFTSGATEANNWVLQRICMQPDSRLITTETEHSSVKALCDVLENRGTSVCRLPVDQLGRVDLQQVADSISADTALVSVQWVNNETGVIQPVEEIARLCRDRGILFHTDASQAIGKLVVDAGQLGCDFLSLSAHKFHGPQGVGGLYVRSGVQLPPFVFGGGQESGRRPGTENLPGIAGAGAAASARNKTLTQSISALAQLRDTFEQSVLQQIPDVFVNGDRSNRVCNTTNLRFEGMDGEALIARLDQRGIRCSQSSACMNQRPEPSYVLRAMGLSELQAYASVRFSFSVLNSSEDLEVSVGILAEEVAKLRRFARTFADSD
jgi:cysteine desulfurase